MGKRLDTKEFINRASSIHGVKYDYSLVNYKNAKTKVKIRCLEHGIFEQVPDSHITQKTGCPFCSKKHKYTNYEFIEKANTIHNFKYDYDFVDYRNNYSKIQIKCKKHGIFTQTPSNHLSGKGCELCNVPKNENLISLFLESKNIIYTQQHKFDDCRYFRRLPFDFYLPELNICIEFQGKQHYEPIEFFGGSAGFIKQKKRDVIKKKYCKYKGINLLIIKYNDNILTNLSKYLLLFT